MSEDAEESGESGERRYRLLGRTVLFVAINGPTTLLTLGLWIRMGARMSKHTASGGDSGTMTLMVVVWVVGILGSAIAIFKK